jgi:hypothetical protein
MRITKKIVFGAIVIGAIAGYVLASPLQFGLCQSTYTFGGRLECLDKIAPMFGEVIILFSMPLFLFSLITYFLREEVFRAWLHFAYGWIPLSIVLILLASGSSGGGFGIPNVLDQEFVAIILAALFAIISLAVIAYKYFATRRTEKV